MKGVRTCWIVIMSYKDGQIRPGRLPFARPIAVDLFELVQSLVQLILCHQITAIVAHLEETQMNTGFVYTPRHKSHGACVHPCEM